MARGLPTALSKGRSLWESEYAKQSFKSILREAASSRIAFAFSAPWRRFPIKPPVYFPSLISALVPIAPVKPNFSAIKSATEKVSELSQQLGAALYAANAAAGESANAGSQAHDGVEDAEIVE